MARLNEPPAAPATATAQTTATAGPQPGVESVDALKRRFIRQNRELAKNNSTQSLRIRSLELEVSRLLADNLELRNQVLHLQNEVYTAQRQASTAAAKKVKEELRAKIAELNGIVDGIEDVQEDLDNTPKEKKPIEGNWRERQSLSELMRDSQMPTIAEDKLYPRRTLGADEIQAIRLSDHSSNESPDLGPPPIARFDYEDPVKHASPLGRKRSPEKAAIGDDDELPAALSVNLETRRRRRDGQPKLEIRRHSLLPQSPAKAEGETSAILRTGAKRKLSDREIEKPIKPPSKGDFSFRSKAAVEESKAVSENAPPETAKVVSEDRAASSPKPLRKVLGDKSVNMSPRKELANPDKIEKPKSDKPAPSRFTAAREASSTRRRRTSAIPLPTPQDEVLEIVEIQPSAPPSVAEPPPQTPAPEDPFSPATSEPSARPFEGRGDTPPPGDLSTLSIATDGGIRPSRRGRGTAVNYAEPSLMAKMRRPDKKMADAVTGLQDPRRAMGAPGDGKSSLSTGRVVAIKQEPVDEGSEDVSWKDLPPAADVGVGSPLNLKGDQPALIESQAHVLSPQPVAHGIVPSTTSATISALMAGSRKRRQSSQQLPLGTDISTTSASNDECTIDIDAAAQKLEELNLYDFKESSSPTTDGSGGKSSTVPDKRKTSHRRHSSAPKDILSKEDDPVVESKTVGRSERVASRRRSMML